jgi:hypothetical protein
VRQLDRQIGTQFFERTGDFDFLCGVEFAARHLLAVAERGVEYLDLCSHYFRVDKC